MEFREFIQIIFNSFNIVLTNISKLFDPILSNNLVKLIIYILIISLIIEFFGSIIDLIKNVVSQKQEAGKNKVSSSRDLE